MEPTKPRVVTAPVILTVVLLITTAAAFFFMLLIFSPSNTFTPPVNMTAEADYAIITERLLSMGDPSRAEALLNTYACAACHIAGGERVAPPWDEIVQVAGERRPPLTAAEYLYESIIDPAAYLVEGYPASMPQDYAARMSEQELADVLIFLLNYGT